MATDLDRWVVSLSLRRIWASSLQQFPRKSMLKSQKQLFQYDRCQTQRPKEFKQCRPFQIYQSALGFWRLFGFRAGKPWEAKGWLVDLKRTAFLWSLSLAPIILKKLYLWLEHLFSRKLLEGWSSNSAILAVKFQLFAQLARWKLNVYFIGLQGEILQVINCEFSEKYGE